MPTTLAQMGSVAKTQAKGQQAQTQATPFTDHLQKDDDLKVQRVKEMEEASKQKIDEKQENPDKRKRRRLKRNEKRFTDGEEEKFEDQDDETAEDADPDQEQLGILIDMRV